MPELPEVETMRRQVAPVAGCRITAVERPACAKRPIQMVPGWSALRRRLEGQRIRGVERVGKRVVLRLDSADSLVLEPRMTGLVLLADPPTREHLRLRLVLEGGPNRQLLFWDRRGLGRVRLATAQQFADLFGSQALGPDALEVSLAALRQRLGGGRREIKVALLDQRCLAGIGNLYAAEILHAAAIHPQTRCSRLSGEQWQRLHAQMRRVLRAAIRYEGSTLADGTYRNALNRAGSYQKHHRVYDRQGNLCPSCRRATIVRIVQAQRATYFCPGCQARSGGARPTQTSERKGK